MRSTISIELLSIEYGPRQYYLYFKCRSSYDSFKKYFIRFCGNDLETNMPIVDDDKVELLRKLANDYDPVPFDSSKTKETFKSKKLYYINS